jgi:hypothetical protein
MPFLKRAWNWTNENWKTILIAVLGGFLMFKSQALASRIETWWPNHENLAEYFIEHLGAVLVVGMLIRIAIEEGYQHAFLGSVNEEVKCQIRASIDEISKESLKPLTDELAKAKESIGNLEVDLKKSISQLATAVTYKLIQGLDDPLLKMLEDRVLNSPFERPEYTIHLTLKPFKDLKSGILEVDVSTCYKVTNNSGKVASYPIYSWLDDVLRPNGVQECDFTRFTFSRVDDTGKAQQVPGFSLPELEKTGQIKPEDGRLTLNYNIENIPEKATYEVIIEGKQLMRNHDVFVWNLVTLTRKMDLTVELVGGLTPRDLNIFPRAIHHAADEVKPEGMNTPKITMHVGQVFLPYQGVEVRWSPNVLPEPAKGDAAQPSPAPLQRRD